MRLTRVGPLSVAKIAFVVYAVMGLFFGAIFAFISVAGAAIGSAANDSSLSMFPGAIFGVGAIVIFPVFYGVLGGLMALAGAALYNVVAGVVGGIEVTLDARPAA
jgi:hypothetical protein